MEVWLNQRHIQRTTKYSVKISSFITGQQCKWKVGIQVLLNTSYSYCPNQLHMRVLYIAASALGDGHATLQAVPYNPGILHFSAKVLNQKFIRTLYCEPCCFSSKWGCHWKAYSAPRPTVGERGHRRVQEWDATSTNWLTVDVPNKSLHNAIEKCSTLQLINRAPSQSRKLPQTS